MRKSYPSDITREQFRKIEADLTGMDTKNLYFYSCDKTANSYRRIEKPAYWIDANGYLRFTTELAGDIIVSEGALMPKGQNTK